MWALGASLYVAVEGHPPYADQPNAIALLNVIAASPPPAPERAGPLSEAIQRMMDPDRSTRWSMAQVAETLHAVAEGTITDQDTDDPVEVTRLMPVPPRGEPAPEQTVERPVPVLARPDPQRRRSMSWLVAGLVVLLLAGAGGWWLTHDTDPSPGAGDGSTSPADKPTEKATDKPTRSPSPDATASESVESPPPSTEPDETSTSPSADGDSASGTAADFVADYYSVLPEDTEAGWQMLSPELQARIGRGTFDGFWATIDDVEVDDVVDDGGDGAVLATITYVTDGGSEQETRRLVVGEDGDSYLITEDQGAV